MDAWLVALIGIQVTFVAFIIWLVVHYHQRRAERRAEERLRLVERFDSGEAFGEFLKSETGRDMLELFRQPVPSLGAVWALSIYVGLISLFLGFGFTFLGWIDVLDDGRSFLVPGALLISAGVGTLVASRLCERILRRPYDPS